MADSQTALTSEAMRGACAETRRELAQLRDALEHYGRCPVHGSFTLHLDGVRRCNFDDCWWESRNGN